MSITAGESGSLYVAGWTEAALPGQTYVGGYDAYIRKYDSDGTELWTRQFGTALNDFAYGVGVDPTGSVYVAGNTLGNMPGADATNPGVLDGFIRKYTSSGDALWTKQLAASSSTFPHAVASDGVHVVLGGETIGALPGEVPLGMSDGWLTWLDASTGVVVNHHRFGSAGGDGVAGLVFVPEDTLFVVGYTFATLPGEIGNGARDGFVGFPGLDHTVWDAGA
jgi:hypothetical protein